MAKTLICPECNNEYWGSIKSPKCSECGYEFSYHEIYNLFRKAFSTVPSYRSVSNDNDKTRIN